MPREAGEGTSAPSGLWPCLVAAVSPPLSPAASGWEHCGEMAPSFVARAGYGEHVALKDTSET